MDTMNFAPYTFLVIMAGLIMASGVYALYWAVKTGQFNRLEQDAKTIFDAEEPVGQVTDHFPGKTEPPAPAGKS